jgi:hypothetical protein
VRQGRCTGEWRLLLLTCLLVGQRTKSSWLGKRGPWHLGGASNAVNVLAVLWTVIICTVMVMPPNARAEWGILSVMGVLFLIHVASGTQDV